MTVRDLLLKIQRNAPHRNTIALSIVSVALIISVALIVTNQSKNDTATNNNNVATSTDSSLISIDKQQEADKDTDGDGFKDWEEILAGSDPLSATSTPQTIQDSQKNTVVSKPKSTSTEQTLTLTDAISRDLFTRFAALKSNDSLDATAKAQLVSDLVANYDSENTTPLFGMRDIKIVGASKDELSAYADAFKLIVNTRLGLMAVALQGKTDTTFIAKAYRQISRDLLKVPAPTPLAELHLATINNYENLANAVEGLIDYEKDPVKGVVALKTFRAADQQRVDLYTSLSSYLSKSGIIF